MTVLLVEFEHQSFSTIAGYIKICNVKTLTVRRINRSLFTAPRYAPRAFIIDEFFHNEPEFSGDCEDAKNEFKLGVPIDSRRPAVQFLGGDCTRAVIGVGVIPKGWREGNEHFNG